jgi:hypothetical protein
MSKTAWKAAALILASALTGPALAQVDQRMPLGTHVAGDAPGAAPPWVTVLFRDFDSIPDFGTFNWIKNAVEVQITTDDQFHDDNPPSCCGVQGYGNLTGRENVKAIWLNVHPRVDLTKLKLYWTGESMPPGASGDACDANGCADTFPAAGLKPSNISIGRNKFRAGPTGCSFDVLIEWKGEDKLGQAAEHSKLLFVYDDAKKNIGFSDFILASDACRNSGDLYMGVAHIQNTDGSEGGGWIKDDVPTVR